MQKKASQLACLEGGGYSCPFISGTREQEQDHLLSPDLLPVGSEKYLKCWQYKEVFLSAMARAESVKFRTAR